MVWQWLWRQRAWPSQARVTIDAQLWARAMEPIPFWSMLSVRDGERLQRLCATFLAQKEFHGLQGLRVTDPMAVQIAAQACRPLLHLAPWTRVEEALKWYDGFVGIVVAPHEMRLPRRWADDETGVVHEGWEEVSGETAQEGPVLLSWPDVQRGLLTGPDWAGGARPAHPYNLVIHEFCHKIDMRDGEADGCPPLPPDFLGARSTGEAREIWRDGLRCAWADHAEQVAAAERFGQAPPWLDPYGATSEVEFFAVACEGYFLDPQRFATEWPALARLFDAFFLRHP